ncbi:hypothetical protein BGZ47_004737 [Haplosporangium gracile]|nr:hypothetical protein BGZ47_004737 [Haplosporangium gracile]
METDDSCNARLSITLFLDMASPPLDLLGYTARPLSGSGRPAYEGVGSLLVSGRGVLESLKDGLGSGLKRPWYPAIRAAYAFVQAGHLKDLKQLIYEAPCLRDPLFQWGICQLLGEIALDSVWTAATRQQAIDFLGQLYRNNQDWGRDETGTTFDEAVNKHVLNLLQELDSNNAPKILHPYPLKSRLPFSDSSSVLTKIQKIPYMEYELYKLRLQRLEEEQQTVYIPPQAEHSLHAKDDE